MNVLKELEFAEMAVRHATSMRLANVPRNFLIVVNRSLKGLFERLSRKDFDGAKHEVDFLVEFLEKNPLKSEEIGFDKKAVELMRKASKVFLKAGIRLEDAEDVTYEIEKVVRRLGIG